MQALVRRIQHEVDNPTDKHKKNIILFKCWNTLRAICENPSFIPKYLNEIDELMLPVIEMIHNPSCLEFEDDIIEVLISTVSLSKSLSKNMKKVVYLFPSIASKFEDKAAQLYVAYNVLLNSGREVFSDPKIVSDMIQIAIRAMTRPDDFQKEYEDVFMTEGVMIMHLTIHVLLVMT